MPRRFSMKNAGAGRGPSVRPGSPGASRRGAWTRSGGPRSRARHRRRSCTRHGARLPASRRRPGRCPVGCSPSVSSVWTPPGGVVMKNRACTPSRAGTRLAGLSASACTSFHAALGDDLGAVRGGIAHESADGGVLREQRVEDGTALLAGGSVDGDGSEGGSWGTPSVRGRAVRSGRCALQGARRVIGRSAERKRWSRARWRRVRSRPARTVSWKPEKAVTSAPAAASTSTSTGTVPADRPSRRWAAESVLELLEVLVDASAHGLVPRAALRGLVGAHAAELLPRIAR